MLRGRGDPERGSVAVTVALALTVLLGFAALVVDIGLNWATRTSAQTAADSAALAGASALLTDGGLAAITTVETYLNNNVPNLVELPDDAGWANDGNEANGEVVCWTMPNPVPLPVPGGVCPDEANALQVTTPPIVVRYAFAPLLGKTTGSIKARAAAGAGPAAPNNCVLCVLDPDAASALLVTGTGGIDVDGGGIVVNSDHDNALVLTGVGDVSANQIRVVGGARDTGLGQLLPPAEVGGPPVPDPLAGLLTPDQLALPPPPALDPAPAISGAVTLTQGVYDSIDVPAGATLTLEEGVYVVTEPAGFRVRDGGRVEGDGATIYLACTDYPAPCDDEDGASFRLDPTGQFQVGPPPATHEYAGLSIFADRGNTAPTLLSGNVDLDGALYTAGSRLQVLSTGPVRIDSLVVVDRLESINTLPLRVSYDPSLPLPGVGRPVLIG